jgi:hypothetical protein
MRQSIRRESVGWKNWVGEAASLGLAIFLVGSIAFVGGLDDWDGASIGLITLVLWIAIYFSLFDVLDRLTP